MVNFDDVFVEQKESEKSSGETTLVAKYFVHYPYSLRYGQMFFDNNGKAIDPEPMIVAPTPINASS